MLPAIIYQNSYYRYLSRIILTGVSWVFLPAFIPEAECQLEFRSFRFWYRFVDSCFIRKEKIVKTVSHSVVEEGRNPEEPFWDKINPFHKDLQLQIISQIDGGEVGNGENEDYCIAYGNIAAYPYILQIITLFGASRTSLSGFYCALPYFLPPILPEQTKDTLSTLPTFRGNTLVSYPKAVK